MARRALHLRETKAAAQLELGWGGPKMRTWESLPTYNGGHRKGSPQGLGMAYAERPGVAIDIVEVYGAWVST